MRAANGNRVTLFPFLNKFGRCEHERSVMGVPATVARLVALHSANAFGGCVLNGIGRGVSVFHASHQLKNPPRNTRLTSTIYDMTCWLLPEMHSKANVKAS